MKKKLVLNKVTICNLRDSELKLAMGGATVTCLPTDTCDQWCQGTTQCPTDPADSVLVCNTNTCAATQRTYCNQSCNCETNEN